MSNTNKLAIIFPYILCLILLISLGWNEAQANSQIAILKERQKMLIDNNLKTLSWVQKVEASLEAERSKPPEVIYDTQTLTIEVHDLAEPQPQLTPPHKVNMNDFYISPDSKRIYLNWDTPISGSKTTGISMNPLVGESSVVLYQLQTASTGIEVGQIILFENELGIIMHQVVEIGQDDLGWYAITRGYNNPANDSIKVREGNLKGIALGVMW